MFERYTERARRVIFWSRYIANQDGMLEIEAEHILLGLLREDMSLAGRFLGSPWALEAVWRKVGQDRAVGEKSLVAMDLPLSTAGKRALTFAAEEADQLSNKHIGTGHLLLGLLREQKSLAAQILYERGVGLRSTREELTRMPHDDSVTEEFIREGSSLPEVVELKTSIRSIMSRAKIAIADHDFDKAHAYRLDERRERDKLYLLCQQHGLLDWLYD